MKLERVVIGVDFSAQSHAAALWTARHFAAGAELVLVHAIEVPHTPEFLKPFVHPQEEIVDTARAGAERRLESFASLSGARVRTDIRVGRPADCLADAAEKEGADLIVVGEHGHRRGPGGLLGSTAEQLVHGAPAPVLLARGLPEGVPQTILMPVDTSPLTAQVLAWGRFLGERFGATSIGLHAISPFVHGRVTMVSSIIRADRYRDEMVDHARRWLADRLGEAGFAEDEVRTEALIGDPVYEINAAVQRLGADLVIMGSRGAGAAGRMLVGSVASAVLRGAGCPVLIVHEPRD